jgi:surfactin synthase thioesterase subunit
VTGGQTLMAGLLVGAALACYLTERKKKKQRRDPVHPHLAALPPPEVRREQLERTAQKLAEAREKRPY